MRPALRSASVAVMLSVLFLSGMIGAEGGEGPFKEFRIAGDLLVFKVAVIGVPGRFTAQDATIELRDSDNIEQVHAISQTRMSRFTEAAPRVIATTSNDGLAIPAHWRGKSIRIRVVTMSSDVPYRDASAVDTTVLFSPWLDVPKAAE